MTISAQKHYPQKQKISGLEFTDITQREWILTHFRRNTKSLGDPVVFCISWTQTVAGVWQRCGSFKMYTVFNITCFCCNDKVSLYMVISLKEKHQYNWVEILHMKLYLHWKAGCLLNRQCGFLLFQQGLSHKHRATATIHVFGILGQSRPYSKKKLWHFQASYVLVAVKALQQVYVYYTENVVTHSPFNKSEYIHAPFKHWMRMSK